MESAQLVVRRVNPTVERFKLEQFRLSLSEAGRSSYTIAGYVSDVQSFVEWFEGSSSEAAPSPEDVTPIDLREYKSSLDSQRLKPATVNRKIAAIRSYFRWGANVGLVSLDPATNLRSKRQTKSAPRWLTRKETWAILRAAQRRIQIAKLKKLDVSAREAVRDNALLALLLFTGLRLEEACNLDVDDIKLGKGRGSVTVRAGKADRWRQVPLNKDARTALKAWLRVRPEVPSSALFVGRREKPFGKAGVGYAIKRLAREARLDVSAVSPHTLRHTFAKSLVDAGVSLDQVAMLLGHENLNTTKIYTTPSQTDLQAAVDGIAWSER